MMVSDDGNAFSLSSVCVQCEHSVCMCAVCVCVCVCARVCVFQYYYAHLCVHIGIVGTGRRLEGSVMA